MGKLLWKPWFWDVFLNIWMGDGIRWFFLRERELKRWYFWVNNPFLPNLPMSSLLNYVDNHAALMIVIVYEDPSCDSKRVGWNHQYWDPGVWLFRTWVEWNKHVCVVSMTLVFYLFGLAVFLWDFGNQCLGLVLSCLLLFRPLRLHMPAWFARSGNTFGSSMWKWTVNKCGKDDCRRYKMLEPECGSSLALQIQISGKELHTSEPKNVCHIWPFTLVFSFLKKCLSHPSPSNHLQPHQVWTSNNTVLGHG